MMANSFSSGQFMGAILQGYIPALANMGWPGCDVREVAEAHILGLFANVESGSRFAIATGMAYIREMA